MHGPSLREARSALLAEKGLTGTAWCRAYAGAADAWLASLLEQAAGGETAGLALIAVGGHGRRELAPGSDVDLVLVHDRPGRIAPIADAVWYPVWDAGISLDHSVRTAKEVRAAMDGDIKVALGLLDGRLVAGDAALAASVLAGALDLWKTRAGRWLPALDGVTRERHARFGDVAFLLEPDLKDGRGGTRDINLLRSLGRVVPILAGVLEDPGLVSAGEVLVSARVELQRATGRPANTLLLQEQDGIAAALGHADADVLMAAVAGAARSVAWANDDGWRRLESWLAGPRGRSGGRDAALEPGLVLRDGEVTLVAGVPVSSDPTLALRAAAASAELDRPIARASLDRLSEEAAAPAGVWPPGALHALLRLLGAGRPAVAAIEALDQRGVWLRYLPEWAAVRNRPQRNAYHRYTVDRHLLETVAGAAGFQHAVDRPDLLLLAALLHDIGKGRGGDHTEQGLEVVASLAPRLGLPAADVETLLALVRHHLLLPDVATRRDLGDPATAGAVATAVGDRGTLELLAALTAADGEATGPSAWSPWKAGLVAELASLASGVLEGRPPPDSGRAALTDAERGLLGSRRLRLVADGERVSVAAPDRPGLLATVAGVLALSGVAVRTATTISDPATAMALLRFDVAPATSDLPDWGRVGATLDAATGGRLSVDAALAEREARHARYRRPTTARPPAVRVDVDNAASDLATVLEVRAPDRAGLLHSVARSLTAAGVSVTCALVSTLGAEAVDVFYVQTLAGDKVTDPAHVERLRTAVATAAAPD